MVKVAIAQLARPPPSRKKKVVHGKRTAGGGVIGRRMSLVNTAPPLPRSRAAELATEEGCKKVSKAEWDWSLAVLKKSDERLERRRLTNGRRYKRLCKERGSGWRQKNPPGHMKKKKRVSAEYQAFRDRKNAQYRLWHSRNQQNKRDAELIFGTACEQSM